jgi:hypothetical protein
MISVSDRKTIASAQGAILSSRKLVLTFFAIWIVFALSGCNSSSGTTTVGESQTPPAPSPVFGPESPQGIDSLVAKDEKVSLSSKQSNNEDAEEETNDQKEIPKVEPQGRS